MRVDAGGGGKAGTRPGEPDRPLALRQRGTDDHDVSDVGVPRAGQDRLAVGVERRIAEMAVGVDQPRSSPPHRDRLSHADRLGAGTGPARHTAALERTSEPPPGDGGGVRGTDPVGRNARAPRATSPARKTSAIVVAIVVPCVSTERGSVSLIDRFRISYRFWRRNLRRFSRTRSKMMIVSFKE